MPILLKRKNGEITPFRNVEFIPAYYFLLNQMIISKNPQFTGKIRGLQAEFTTSLLLYGKALICC